MTPPPPTPEHLWLAQLLGSWSWVGEPVVRDGHDHDHGPQSGTETVRAIGEIWVQGDGAGDHGLTQMTLGFDPASGRFVGTWIGSMMPYLWVYDGALEGDRLTLNAVGPSMLGEGNANYRDLVERTGPDERTLRAYVEGPPGTWTHFMTTRYRRA